MRLLAACSLGGAGHLNPLSTVLDAALRRDHDVRIAVPPALEAMTTAAGYRCVVCGEPPEEDVAPIRERLPTAPPEQAAVLGNRELFGRLATAAMRPGMERLVEEWRPEVVVRDPCEYASAIVAHRQGIPSIQVAISLAEVEASSLTIAAAALEPMCRGVVEHIRASSYVTRFPASIDPSPFPRTHRFREESPQSSARLPNWWKGREGPLIYMSFGTVLGHMERAPGVYVAALEAAGQLDARVLLTVGRTVDVSSIGAIPDNVHIEAWVPQRDVFEHADLVICHGGAGTAFGALAAGVPLVVVPLFADQFVNGRRIARAGAAVVVEGGASGFARDSVPALIDASRTVLAEDAYRAAARRLAKEMSALPTADDVVDLLLPDARFRGR